VCVLCVAVSTEYRDDVDHIGLSVHVLCYSFGFTILRLGHRLFSLFWYSGEFHPVRYLYEVRGWSQRNLVE
jgi:hypothetical protein